jgi:hypothetical protein
MVSSKSTGEQEPDLTLSSKGQKLKKQNDEEKRTGSEEHKINKKNPSNEEVGDTSIKKKRESKKQKKKKGHTMCAVTMKHSLLNFAASLAVARNDEERVKLINKTVDNINKFQKSGASESVTFKQYEEAKTVVKDLQESHGSDASDEMEDSD